jgi:chromate transport protein ChrA
MPGLGQFFLKWYLRGTLEALAAIVAFLWAVYALMHPIFSAVYMDLSREELPTPDFRSFGIAITITLLVWAWSMLEILIFYRPLKNAENASKEKLIKFAQKIKEEHDS